jgi:hypothetical protein
MTTHHFTPHPVSLSLLLPAMSPPEVKPSITGLSTLPSRPNDIDTKPHLSDDEEISFSHQTESIKIQRELLRDLYQERTSKLDLQEELVKVKEENYLLKRGKRSKSRRAGIKVEPGVERDIKPVISGVGEAGPSGKKDDIDDDDDEVVFLREVRGDVVNDITASQGTLPHQVSE